MSKDIASMLAQEAEEAEARADAEERGEVEPQPGQRAKRQGRDATQVYTVRIPVDRLEELRAVAARMGVAPSALLRQWALERLDQELTGKVGRVAAPFDSAAIAGEVAAATQAAVIDAIRGLVDSVPELQAALRQNVASNQHRYLDPSGPVRLGATRRLATALSPSDLTSNEVESPTVGADSV